MQNTFSQSGNDSKWFLKKSFFKIGMWHSRPPRDPPPFMANAILNFHFDFLTPSLSSFRSFKLQLVLMLFWKRKTEHEVLSRQLGPSTLGPSKSAGPNLPGPNLPWTMEIVLESILARECVRYNLKSEVHISWSLKYWIQCKGSRQKPFAALFRAFLHQPPPQRRGNQQVIGQFWYMCNSLLN